MRSGHLNALPFGWQAVTAAATAPSVHPITPHTTFPNPNSSRARLPACSIADELFGSFENLLTLSDKRGIPYDRWV